MNLYELGAAASPAIAQLAIDAVWQGAAVALALFLSLRLAPRVSAAHRFAAWAAGFALVAALPLLPFAVHLFSGPAGAVSLSSSAVAARPWLELDSRWALAIAALWLAGSAFRFGDLVVHAVRLRRLWKTATPVADEALLPTNGLPRAVVCTTTELDRPSVIGFFAPRILIPEWLYARLTPQELEQVVLHEMEHLCRHDDWTNLIQKLVLVLFPLSPALAWIERRLCREREMACDEGVVRRTHAPRAYAACLASLAERGMQRDLERRAAVLSLAAWRRRPELVHRVHGILSRKSALSPAAARVLLSAVGCGLLAGTVEIARCPQVVAFVAAPGPEQLAQADAVNIDRAAYAPASAPQLASGYHVVQAKAILPGTRSQETAAAPAQTRRAASRLPATIENEMAWRDAAPHESLLRAEMPSEAGGRNVRQTYDAPQFVVWTAVERVQTFPQNSREIADYDTGGASDQDAAAEAPDASRRSGAAPAQQIVFARLIFRIEAAPAAPDQAKGSAQDSPGKDSLGKDSPSKPATDSKQVSLAPVQSVPVQSTPVQSVPVRQRALIPFGDGWLVFQL